MVELTAYIAISCRLDVGKELPQTVGLRSNRVLQSLQLGLKSTMTPRSSDLDWPLKKPCSLLCVIVEWFDYGPTY